MLPKVTMCRPKELLSFGLSVSSVVLSFPLKVSLPKSQNGCCPLKEIRAPSVCRFSHFLQFHNAWVSRPKELHRFCLVQWIWLEISITFLSRSADHVGAQGSYDCLSVREYWLLCHISDRSSWDWIRCIFNLCEFPPDKHWGISHCYVVTCFGTK